MALNFASLEQPPPEQLDNFPGDSTSHNHDDLTSMSVFQKLRRFWDTYTAVIPGYH